MSLTKRWAEENDLYPEDVEGYEEYEQFEAEMEANEQALAESREGFYDPPPEEYDFTYSDLAHEQQKLAETRIIEPPTAPDDDYPF